MKGWAKIKPAAKYAGISPRTLSSWLKAGLNHSRLPSGTVLIAYADIDAYLKEFAACENRADKIVEQICKDMYE